MNSLPLLTAMLMANAPMPEVASFVSACVDGKLMVTDGKAKPVSLKDLPSQLRDYLGGWEHGKFYKISGKSDGYLLTISGEPSKLTGLRDICAFAAKELHFPIAHDQVMREIFGSAANLPKRPDTPPYMMFYNPKENYLISARLLSPHWEPKDSYSYSILLLGRFNLTDRPTVEAFIKQMPEGSIRTNWRTGRPWPGQEPPAPAANRQERK